MAVFRYKAQGPDGKMLSGKMQAVDENDLHMKLKEDGKFLISADIEDAVKTVRPLKSKQLADFCREIGTLLSSGVSLVRALKIISEEETLSNKERMLYGNVLVLIRQGVPLSEALEQQQGAFPLLLINMVHAAEASGNLDKTAFRMAEYFDKEYKLNAKIKSSTTYPKILSVMIVAVVIIIMSYVIPQFTSLFERMTTLPFMTRVLFAVSDFVKAHWIGLIIALILVVGVWKLVGTIPQVHLFKDKLKVQLPVFGKLEKVIYTARFARTLSSLYTSGIPIVTTLQISRKTIGNYYIENQFDEVINKVRTGGSLSDALAGVDGFTNKLTSTIRIGEETGSLDSMLISTADNLDFEAEKAIERMVTFLEPVMIVIMAFIVGFIMLAVIVPIYSSYQTIGGSTY